MVWVKKGGTAWVKAVMMASHNASQDPHTESEIQACDFFCACSWIGKMQNAHLVSGQCWWHWARERFRTRTRLRWIPTCTSPPSMLLAIYSLPVNEAAVIQSQPRWCLLPHLSFSFFPSPSLQEVLERSLLMPTFQSSVLSQSSVVLQFGSNFMVFSRNSEEVTSPPLPVHP